MCSGLVLVPAAPNAFRRVGRFAELPPDVLRGVPEQELVIV